MSIQPVRGRIPIAILATPLMLLALPLTGARTVATGTSSPEPSPSPGSSSAVAAAPVSGIFSLSTLMLFASFAVIAMALFFAIRYHKALLEFMTKSLARGTAYSGNSVPVYDEVHHLLPPSDSPVHIVGPATGVSDQELLFVLSTQLFDATQTPPRVLDVQWSVDGTPVDGTTKHFFKHAFEQSGVYVVEATADNRSVPPFIIEIAAPKATGGLSLPFAIQNWGRMVVLLFGLGVVGALMASAVLSSEAGAGLLGALLGIGAATAGSGDGNVGKGATDGTATDKNP